ncbi:DUF2259 domain-containing protein [Bdellovibrio sp. HCB288]|uniref:DUF2259 domain-containing protein n=1 Tax=Bdellovibrio sp. HCB288 TaxID=3394355 RepID=UPI0039B36F85
MKSLQNYDSTPVLTVKQMAYEGDARAALKISMQSVNFSAYNIAPGTNKGSTLSATSSSEITVNTNGAAYKFTLSTEATQNRPEYCIDAPNEALLKINLTKTASQSSETSVLVDEQYAPEKRACAYNYAIEKVITYGDKAALVISYLATGFEGPDHNYTVVTTILE